MNIGRRRDFWSGVMFFGSGTAFAIGGLSYDRGTSAMPGAGYFPLGMGIILAALGLMIAIAAIFAHSEDGQPVGRFAWRPLIIILSAVAIFAFLLPLSGLSIAMPILFIMGAFAGFEFRWRDALIGAAALTIGSYLVFNVMLDLRIPLWPYFIENPAR